MSVRPISSVRRPSFTVGLMRFAGIVLAALLLALCAGLLGIVLILFAGP